MNFLKCFLLISISLLLFSSCEDVIELDLDTTDPQLVIEASLDAGNQIATVVITKSNDFYDNNAPERISGANISLQSGAGEEYILPETSAGTYTVGNIIVKPEEVFTISVEVEGEIYEASTQVPAEVVLNEVEILDNINTPFGGDEGSIRISAKWDDPAGIENFYRIRTYVDNVPQVDTYTVLTDVFAGDGKEQNIPIRELFEENTSVTVELLCTDEDYYDYFFQLSSLVGEGGNSTTPYNPEGNFDGEVLGYFGIYYSSNLSIDL